MQQRRGCDRGAATGALLASRVSALCILSPPRGSSSTGDLPLELEHVRVVRAGEEQRRGQPEAAASESGCCSRPAESESELRQSGRRSSSKPRREQQADATEGSEEAAADSRLRSCIEPSVAEQERSILTQPCFMRWSQRYIRWRLSYPRHDSRQRKYVRPSGYAAKLRIFRSHLARHLFSASACDAECGECDRGADGLALCSSSRCAAVAATRSPRRCFAARCSPSRCCCAELPTHRIGCCPPCLLLRCAEFAAI